MWQKIKNAIAWTWEKIKAGWAWFELQCNKLAPGFKTILVNGVTAVGTSATAIAAYLKDVPAEQVFNAKYVAIALFVVSTLSWWLHGLGDRVDSRTQEN